MAHGPIEPERLIINATHSSLTQHADIRNIRASVPFHGDSESEMKGEQQLLANQRRVKQFRAAESDLARHVRLAADLQRAARIQARGPPELLGKVMEI